MGQRATRRLAEGVICGGGAAVDYGERFVVPRFARTRGWAVN
jgi:hypothetical protein